MVTNDEALVSLKHKVMEEVCKLAWKGELTEEGKEAIVYEIIPGPQAQFRCCIYKEREIIRQRIRLANAQNTPDHPDSNNTVQVISPACEECSIAAYSVTDNCRFCMGKACKNSCKFDAIAPGEVRMHINPSKCKECGMCAKACPYGAIVHLERPCKKVCPVGAITYNEYGVCRIDENKCIECGHCIHACPFGAIGSKTYLVPVIQAIREGKEVIAMVAPSIEGQFGEGVTMGALKNTMKKIGFTDMVEVGLGGDMTAAYEAQEWLEAKAEGKKMTTSCCPAFVNMMKKHYPKVYEENMSKTVSPMAAVSAYLKATRPGCVTVFIGPCIAKKSETMDPDVENNADFAITFGELNALRRSKGLHFEEGENDYQESSIWGKRFATSGGVANAVVECMQESGADTSDIKILKANGGADCKKAMLLLSNDRLPEDFVEGMVCPGGCLGGPSKHKTELEVMKARNSLLAKADDRGVLANLEKYPMDQIEMHRTKHVASAE